MLNVRACGRRTNARVFSETDRRGSSGLRNFRLFFPLFVQLAMIVAVIVAVGIAATRGAFLFLAHLFLIALLLSKFHGHCGLVE